MPALVVLPAIILLSPSLTPPTRLLLPNRFKPIPLLPAVKPSGATPIWLHRKLALLAVSVVSTALWAKLVIDKPFRVKSLACTVKPALVLLKPVPSNCTFKLRP